jgi:hypothetical protein
MPMMRNQFDDLFFARLPYLNRVFFEEYGEPDAMFERVFNVETSNRMREQTTGVTGFQMASEKPEGESVIYDRLLQAYDKTFTHTTYALGFQVTEEAFEDDLDGPMRQGAKALARSMRTTKNTIVWNVYNNGFGTEQSPDGVAVFSNSHPLIEGGTFDNLVEADLSISSLETALNIFDDMRDQRNLLIELEPSLLLYPPELRWLVGEILRSPDKPDTTNRAINVLQGILTPISVKWLTGDDDWFVGVPPGQSKLMLWNRRNLNISSDTDFDSGNGKTKATQRHSQGWGDWVGWVGGQGQ